MISQENVLENICWVGIDFLYFWELWELDLFSESDFSHDYSDWHQFFMTVRDADSSLAPKNQKHGVRLVLEQTRQVQI